MYTTLDTIIFDYRHNIVSGNYVCIRECHDCLWRSDTQGAALMMLILYDTPPVPA